MSRLVVVGLSLALVGGAVPAAATETAPVVVNVAAFGADPTGHIDSAPAVTAALRHAKAVNNRPVRIVFPRGVYQLYPERAETRELYVSNTVGADQQYRDKQIGLLVEDMHDVTIDGGGAEFVYHGLQTAFASIRSTNVSFTNFSFDYAAPEVIDATVASAGVTGGHAYRVLSIPAGSPYRLGGNHITWLGETSPVTGQPYWSGVDGLEYTQIHDPVAQRTWRADNPLFTGVATVTDLGGRRIRIDYTSGTAPSDAGLVYQLRLIERAQPGAFIWESRDVTLRSMNAYYLQTLPAGVQIGGTVAENLTYTPSVVISGNVFRNVPTRGILVTTPKPVLITGNRFDGMSMASVYISADAYQWYESGAVDNVMIRGNTFTRLAGPVIFVEPTNQVLDPANPVHHNISVEDNWFDVGDVTVVDAKSVGDFTFTGNTVRRLDRTGAYSSPLFRFHGSSGIQIAHNHYDKGLNTTVVQD
jgi:hypothetical protein